MIEFSQIYSGLTKQVRSTRNVLKMTHFPQTFPLIVCSDIRWYDLSNFISTSNLGKTEKNIIKKSEISSLQDNTKFWKKLFTILSVGKILQ